MKNRQPLLVFDADGTTIDSMPWLITYGTEIIRRVGCLTADEARRRYVRTMGRPFKHQLEMALPDCSEDEQNMGVIEFTAAKQRVYHQFKPFSGLRQLLTDVRLLGFVPVIVSSTDPDKLALWLRTHRVSVFTFPQRKKTALACITGNNSGGIRFIGDTLYDAELARRYGMQFIGVRYTLPDWDTALYPVLDDLHGVRRYLARHLGRIKN